MKCRLCGETYRVEDDSGYYSHHREDYNTELPPPCVEALQSKITRLTKEISVLQGAMCSSEQSWRDLREENAALRELLEEFANECGDYYDLIKIKRKIRAVLTLIHQEPVLYGDREEWESK